MKNNVNVSLVVPSIRTCSSERSKFFMLHPLASTAARPRGRLNRLVSLCCRSRRPSKLCLSDRTAGRLDCPGRSGSNRKGRARVRKLAGDAQEDQIFIATWLCWPNSERVYTALSLALLLAGQLLDQKPAVKSRPVLTLRPPELSGRDVEHLTEVTRQVALIGESYSIRNLRQ